MIGIDWGTTSFRAFRIARDGTIRDRRSGPRGILNVVNNRFAPDESGNRFAAAQAGRDYSASLRVAVTGEYPDVCKVDCVPELAA